MLGLDELIRTAKALGMTVGGNYTFGYPDETYDEMTQTLMLAHHHMQVGMDKANLMIIQPIPSTSCMIVRCAAAICRPILIRTS